MLVFRSSYETGWILGSNPSLFWLPRLVVCGAMIQQSSDELDQLCKQSWNLEFAFWFLRLFRKDKRSCFECCMLFSQLSCLLELTSTSMFPQSHRPCTPSANMHFSLSNSYKFHLSTLCCKCQRHNQLFLHQALICSQPILDTLHFLHQFRSVLHNRHTIVLHSFLWCRTLLLGSWSFAEEFL